jgi:hypothetical protein
MAMSISQQIPLPVCSERAVPRPEGARQGGGQGGDGFPAGGTASSRVPLDLWSLRGELDQLGVSALQAHLSEQRGEGRLRLAGELTGLDFLCGSSLGVLAWHCQEVRGAGRKPCSGLDRSAPCSGIMALISLPIWFELDDPVGQAVTGTRAQRSAVFLATPSGSRPRGVPLVARAFAGDLGDFYVG